MINLNKIYLENVVLFSKAGFTFKPGLTVVRGRNQDAKTKGQNNGAGKSLLFSSIPNVLFNASPLARRKNSKRDLLSTKSSIRLDFVVGEEELSIVQKASSYSVIENGSDIKIRTIPLAEKYIQEHIPITREEFYSTTYIQSQRECLFSKGTDVDRLSFISNVFRLESYDVLKSILSERLKAIKVKEVEYSTLQTKRLSLLKKLESLKWTDKKAAHLDKSLKYLEVLEESFEHTQEQKYEAESFVRGVIRLNDLEIDLDKLRKKYSYKKHPSEMLPLIEKEKKESLAYTNYVQALKSYKENTLSIKRQISDIPQCSFIEESDLLAEISEIEDHVEELGEIEFVREERLRRKTRLKKELDSLLSDAGLNDVPEIPDNIESQIHIYSHLIDIPLDDTEGGQCPLCMSSLKNKDILEDARKIYDELKTLKRIADVNTSYMEVKVPKSKARELKRVTKSLDRLLVKKEKIQKNNANARRRNELEELLSGIKKPKSVSWARDLGLVEEDIRLCNSILTFVSAREEIWSTYPGIKEFFSINADPVLKAKRKVDDLQRRLRRAQIRLSDLKSNIRDTEISKNSYSLYSYEISEIDRSLQELKRAVSEKKIYEALVEAYGVKGIKILAIKNIASVLKTNLNLYSPLIFSEKFKFDIEVKTTGIKILVDRNNGNISDVRLLSGSESDCFRLLLLVSLLPLLPSSRRMNFLVLDEPDCHMDDSTRERFIQNMLPAIQEVVPNIVLITPLETKYDDATREYHVVKEKGVSALKKVAL